MTKPAPTPKPGATTKISRDDKAIPRESAKPIAAENQETRHEARKDKPAK
jgi:hypothetical protein